MKLIFEYQNSKKEIELDLKEQEEQNNIHSNLSDTLKSTAYKLFPELQHEQIELITESGLEIIQTQQKEQQQEQQLQNNKQKQEEDNINKEQKSFLITIRIIEENWQMIKSNEEMNIMNQICNSVQNINLNEYTKELHNQIRDDLIVSFQPYYTYFAEKLSSLETIQNASTQNMSSILTQIINSIHERIQKFDFTGAYIVKLCCDYINPLQNSTFNLLEFPNNLLKHKQEFIDYIDEHLFDIVAAEHLQDKKRLEQLIEGNNNLFEQKNNNNLDLNNRINKIIKRQDSSEQIIDHTKKEQKILNDQEQLSSDFNFEITKLKLIMKCEFYAESWITIQILKRQFNKLNEEFEELKKFEEEVIKIINSRNNNSLERLVIKSIELTFEQLMNEIEMLVIPDKTKSILLIQLYNLRPQIDIKIPDYVREKHSTLLSEGEFASNSLPKHDKKISCICLDGGGIRGVIQLLLLTELEHLTQKKCSELFDFFAGTSIGGIISLALASGHSAQSLLYKFIGHTKNHIFSSRHYVRYLLGVKPDGDDSQFSYALYNKDGIENELLDFFHDIPLDELKSNVLVTSCEIQNNELLPVVFTKIEDKCGKQNIIGIHPQLEIDTSFSKVKLRDIARASSAAYPFFSATVINSIPFVDGGFLFNNVDILVTTYLLGHGYKKSNIKILSLGNAPKEIASSSHGLEHARTAILGLVNCLKGIVNPETYYEQYFAMSNLNLDHSLVETKKYLNENYIRLEPDYSGQAISLDCVTIDAINNLKTIGTNWIQSLNQTSTFSTICSVILDSKVTISSDDSSVIIMPRYYSYPDSYQSIDQAIKDNNIDEWKKSLMNFQFTDISQQIIQPRSFMSTIKSYINNKFNQEDHILLNRAVSIGHIPSISKILEGKDINQKKELILKESINYWNSLHYAAANGEIASFLYLLSVLLDTDLFLPKTNNIIPERVKKCLSNIEWITIRQNIKSFLNDKLSKNLPYSNVYGPVFNFHQVDTIHLAIENKQFAFEKIINQILSD